jgi:hypothetical protein
VLSLEAALPAAILRRHYKFSLRKAHMHCILGLLCRFEGRLRDALAHYEAGIATLEALHQPLDDGQETEVMHSMHFKAATLCDARGLNDAAAYVHHMRRGVKTGEEANAAAWLRRMAAMSDQELRAKMHDERWLAPSQEQSDATWAEMEDEFEDFLDGVPRKPRACGACGAEDAPPERKHALCGACLLIAYCSKACQTAHWRAHKVPCKAARAAARKAEA